MRSLEATTLPETLCKADNIVPEAKLNTGIQAYFRQHGDGPDLVLNAGLAADHSAWALVLEQLAKNFRVLVFDNRGTGQTDSPNGPYSIDMLAEDTLALMDHLGIEKAPIVGHSMGGAILQHICINHPNRVQKAVILASFEKPSHACLFHIRTVAKYIQANVEPRLIIETGLPWIYGNEFLKDVRKTEEAIATILNNPHPQPLAGFEGQVEAIARFDSSDDLKRIITPTLILSGEDDISTLR